MSKLLLDLFYITMFCGGSFILYKVYVWVVAYLEVRTQPREPMFLCNKHGPIRREHLIHFQSAPDTWIDYCPVCFHERLKGAEVIK